MSSAKLKRKHERRFYEGCVWESANGWLWWYDHVDRTWMTERSGSIIEVGPNARYLTRGYGPFTLVGGPRGCPSRRSDEE
jgi:hypothetical protein